MTKRFWRVVGCIYTLLLISMISLQGEVIILALPLLAYLAAAALFAPPPVRLKVKRELDMSVARQNLPVKVKMSLENEGPGADELSIEDDLPDDMEILEGEPHKRQPLAEAEKIEYEYTIRSKRGSHSFRGLTVEQSEHFGLLTQSKYLPTQVDYQPVPETLPLGEIEIHPQASRGFYGPIAARQSGHGMSFWGVREYQMGDTRRRINWKISARHPQTLFTNQFEQERIADVGLILDAREQTNLRLTERDGTEMRPLFEYSVLATAALAEAFLAQGHRVSLLSYGYGMQRVFPGYGKTQRQNILRTLAKVKPGSSYAMESLERLPIRLFAPRSQLVMVTPLSPEDYPAFLRLRKYGYDVLLVSPNPVAFEEQALRGMVSHVELQHARRLAYLERNLLLRKLLRLGVQVVDWPVDQPLEKALHNALSQPFIRRNLKVMI